MNINLLRVVALLLLSTQVFALSGKTFSWAAPTEYNDNSPLADNEISEFRIYCDSDPNPVWVQTNVPNDSDTWIAPNNTFALGSHTCHATAVDIQGRESNASNTVNFIVTLERPNPPVFAVQ